MTNTAFSARSAATSSESGSAATASPPTVAIPRSSRDGTLARHAAGRSEAVGVCACRRADEVLERRSWRRSRGPRRRPVRRRGRARGGRAGSGARAPSRAAACRRRAGRRPPRRAPARRRGGSDGGSCGCRARAVGSLLAGDDSSRSAAARGVPPSSARRAGSGYSTQARAGLRPARVERGRQVDLRAVGRQHRGAERLDRRGLDERHRAAAEARAGHARAVARRLPARELGDQVQLRAGDLVEVAQAGVRVVHQPAGEREVVLREAPRPSPRAAGSRAPRGWRA